MSAGLFELREHNPCKHCAKEYHEQTAGPVQKLTYTTTDSARTHVTEQPCDDIRNAFPVLLMPFISLLVEPGIKRKC